MTASLPFDVYLITPTASPEQTYELVELAFGGARPGRVGLQLRAKHLEARSLFLLAERLRELCERAHVAFLVNGRADVAKALHADGLHLPEDGLPIGVARELLGPDAVIGVSRHDIRGVESAEALGASFATLSPFASSPGKGPVLAREAFVAACASGLPVFALGGIDAHNAAAAIATGASGVAAIRSIFEAGEPGRALEELLGALDRARRAEP